MRNLWYKLYAFLGFTCYFSIVSVNETRRVITWKVPGSKKEINLFSWRIRSEIDYACMFLRMLYQQDVKKARQIESQILGSLLLNMR